MQYDEILSAIWLGTNPYQGFNFKRYRADLQGWNSQHPYLKDTIVKRRPKIVVEVGVWKGKSIIFMAKAIQDEKLASTVIAVDTFLGSWEHWQKQQWFDDLMFQNGYPTLFHTFMTNMFEEKVTDTVVPLPLDSANAAILLKQKKIIPDVIHIDGGHDYEAVSSDLRRWWPILAPGGTLIMDDYDPTGKVWPSVRQAIEDFRQQGDLLNFESSPFKCRFQKPTA